MAAPLAFVYRINNHNATREGTSGRNWGVSKNVVQFYTLGPHGSSARKYLAAVQQFSVTHLWYQVLWSLMRRHISSICISSRTDILYPPPSSPLHILLLLTTCISALSCFSPNVAQRLSHYSVTIIVPSSFQSRVLWEDESYVDLYSKQCQFSLHVLWNKMLFLLPLVWVGFRTT